MDAVMTAGGGFRVGSSDNRVVGGTPLTRCVPSGRAMLVELSQRASFENAAAAVNIERREVG